MVKRKTDIDYIDARIDVKAFNHKIKKIRIPPIERRWYKCPKCGAKLAIIDNTTRCSHLFIKCRVCKNEIEVKI
ncbi:MAG: hypothetical protein ACI4S2_01420 [Lachnospiraceae bacterium]